MSELYKALEASHKEFERQLEQYVCPNPTANGLLFEVRDYNSTELADMLQRFGAYLASLHYHESKHEAMIHALKEAYKSGMQIEITKDGIKSSTVAGREGEVLASNEVMRDTRQIQIVEESKLLILKGWVAAYETAYNTASRLVTLYTSDLSLATGRHA